VKLHSLVLSGKIAVIFIVLGLVTSSLVLMEPANAQMSAATRVIEIKPDGSIVDSDPVTPLQQSENVYTFTGDVYGRIDVEKSGVILDGASYSLTKSGTKDFAVMVGGIAGLDLPQVDGVTVENMKIVGFHYAISLHGASDVVYGVTITGGTDYNGVGIWVGGSNHIIQRCHIAGNKGQGMLIDANDTLISDNVITDNGNYGIYFYDTPGKLRNNILNNNTGGPFHMEEMSLRNPGQPFKIASDDIDPSNLVDGKPVYYWVNEYDKIVPSNAGYVVLDNCTDITVENLSISRDPTGYYSYYSHAISLIRSKNIQVANNNLSGASIWCSYSSQDITIYSNNITIGGIYAYSSNISIIGNYISASKDYGITIGGPAKATVAQNVLTGCETGISLTCSLTRIIQNSIKDCNVGISLFSSNNNTVTHNNFINNKQQVSEEHYSLQWPMTTYYQSFNNTWDGNYWSTYTGLDADGNGIGDNPYVIFENITDYHPLMAQYKIDTELPPLPDSENPAPTPSPSTPLSSPSTLPSATATTTVIDKLPEFDSTALVVVALASGLLAVGAGLFVYFKMHHSVSGSIQHSN
jgi:parallel beta-helix repeat protein